MILIIGANGTAGRAVIGELARLGAPVRAFVSNAGSAREIEAIGADPIIGNMRDAEAIRGALADIETIYHIAPDHAGATYELCSTAQPIDRHHMADALSAAFGVEIRTVRCDIEDLQGSHFFAALMPVQRQQLANMYDHIDQFGTAYFNNDVLEMLTGEASTSYGAFAGELASKFPRTDV